MAVSGLSFACKPHFSLHPPLFSCFRKIRFGSVAAIETLDEPETFIKHTNTQTSDSSPVKNGSSFKVFFGVIYLLFILLDFNF
ncbi:hypothetical protein REPUB_Repub08aG0028500 [Reevesia pubescens]